MMKEYKKGKEPWKILEEMRNYPEHLPSIFGKADPSYSMVNQPCQTIQIQIHQQELPWYLAPPIWHVLKYHGKSYQMFIWSLPIWGAWSGDGNSALLIKEHRNKAVSSAKGNCSSFGGT